MAPFNRNKLLYSFLLLLVSSATPGLADTEDADDGVTVETVEEVEEQYHSPQIGSSNVYFAEHFDDEKIFNKRWVRSEAKKQGVDENIAKYDGKWEIQTPARKIFKDDLGLVLTTEAKHAAISAMLDRQFVFKDKPLIVQYEVTMQEGQNCGGAYLKLLSRGTNSKADLRHFHDQTPYTIMFGPDKCGNDNKLHFIFRHQNPRNGTIEEKHAKKPTTRLDDIYKDKEPHLYTLIVRPDNTYSILVDNKDVNSGSLLEDFTPSVNPPEEIDDPNDKKPEEWDEREKIVDPSATKPEDWDEDAPAQIVDPNAVKPDGWLDDEPDMVPDPEARKPADWDEEMDGEWEAPLIDNPACTAAPGCGTWSAPTIPNPSYKGKWRAPLIPNPNYKGKWTPRRIANPEYFRDDNPFNMIQITAVGFELWSMSPQLLFDNVLVTDSETAAAEWAAQSFSLKRAKMSKDSQTLWGRILRATNYKPGYWALYGIYVAIPITFYIVMLYRRAKEESVVERALALAGDHPWLYAVGILVAFLIVGVGAYLCCGSKGESEAKKTDAPVEDDPHESEGEPEEEPLSTEREDKPASKAQLERDDEDKEEHAETAPLVDTDGAGDGQRKRKPRKE